MYSRVSRDYHVQGQCRRRDAREMIDCPICSKSVKEININAHIDAGCASHLEDVQETPVAQQQQQQQQQQNGKASFSSFFQKTSPTSATRSVGNDFTTPSKLSEPSQEVAASIPNGHQVPPPEQPCKRPLSDTHPIEPPTKRSKPNPLTEAAPLAERLRPKTLDEVIGQPILAPDGLLRALIESNNIPSLILWGGPGTGKTTIARLIAKTGGTRFVEINSTSTGVSECKKLFTEARSELGLTGRKTIIFCDELHRFSKSQQDVFLAPVEAGYVTLIGATTENPSFKIVNALLSRCRTFTLNPLTEHDILTILRRAVSYLYPPDAPSPTPSLLTSTTEPSTLLAHIARSSPADARTALTLLSLSIPLLTRPNNPLTTLTTLGPALSQTVNLTYDRLSDLHYGHISAFQKSIRGSDPNAALYYLARMLSAGEDALFIARRLVVIASEDVGLADNSILPLVSAAYVAAEKVGMPEARINLAHATVACALAPKSTRAYRGLKNAMDAVRERPEAEVPIHLRQGTTRLVRELGWGEGYKYNPAFKDGKVEQEYLPECLRGRTFLEDRDLGERSDDE
ncbi:MAG: hypothetical protein M1828_005620 [Chrysothrix sp. TS-e1954]|nr:MAG: hypothetical protein M1828_005620 [Chrysothrix sp. TS-e1954]